MIADAELGTIEFIRNKRSKHIRVHILSNGLRVSLPHYLTQDDAMKFIHSVRDKLIQKQTILEKGLQKNNILINENSRLQTHTFSVEAKSNERTNIFFSLKNGVLSIEFPQGTDCTDKQTQEYFWNGISYFMRKEAKRLLPDRTRWGSCSRAQSINLSLYLLLLPSHLIDYVILHELCHTKEMNHGANFWIWMDRVTDYKSKEFQAELKKFHMP